MAYPVFNTGDRLTGGLLQKATPGLTGVSNSRTLSAVCIFTPRTEEFENRRMIWPGDGGKVNIFGQWAYICYVNLKDAADNTVIGANIELPQDVRYVMAISVDRDAADFAGALKWIVNGSTPTISQSGTYAPGTDNILEGEVWNLFNRDVGDSGITADIELLGLTTEYIDFSDPTNWAKLIDPKQTGPAGEGLSATGTAWPLWIVGDPARATAGTANLGTGGAFTKSGTGFTEVTAAPWPPILDLTATPSAGPYEVGTPIDVLIEPDGYAVGGTTIDMAADGAGTWTADPVNLPAGRDGVTATFTPSAAANPLGISGTHSGSYTNFTPLALEVTGGSGIPFTILQGQTGILLGIDWSEYEPGVYRVSVTLDGFDDPVTFDVTILADVEVTTTLDHASREVGQSGTVTFTLDTAYGVDTIITPSATGVDVTFDNETVTIPAGQLSASTAFLCNAAGEGTIGGADDQGMTGPNSVPLEITEVVAPPVLLEPFPDRNNYVGAVVSFDASAYFENATSYSATGLPTGLSIDSGTGVVSGTISAGANTSSPFAAEITATNSGGSTPGDFAWVVLAVPVWSVIPDRNINLGSSGSWNLAPYITGTGHTFSDPGNTLPAWADIASNGLLTWTNADPLGDTPVSIRATTFDGVQIDSPEFDLKVVEPVVGGGGYNMGLSLSLRLGL